MAEQALPQDLVAASSSQGLKRRASFDAEDDDTIRTKRRKENDASREEAAVAASLEVVPAMPAVDGVAFAEELAQELQCGCCSELVYRPVVVNPCQHFFCGSCCVLWIRNGGSNCPACRGASTTVVPSRPLQTVLDVLLRAVPTKMRTERERQQADAVYVAGTVMRIPPPREPSPTPNLNPSDYARPCPHCQAGNMFGWTCPLPIVDPQVDADRAWPLDDGTPPGHVFCGNCENLTATRAPTTTRCDFCQVSFCGVNIPGRCVATHIISQHLHEMAEVEDLIQSSDVYECFNNNTIEVDLMLDYLTSRNLTPRNIYRDIVVHIQRQPNKFQPLLDEDLFSDLHQVSPGADVPTTGERQKICRMCATEVMLWGLKDWWIRVRPVDAHRLDCSEGGLCHRQKDLAHAKEYNHIIGIPPPPTTEQSSQPIASSSDAPLDILGPVPDEMTDGSTPTREDTPMFDLASVPIHSQEIPQAISF